MQTTENQKTMHLLSWVTLTATFVMGIIDAYTFLAQHETFVSAQTGNMIVFAVRFAQSGWQAGATNVLMWLSFIVGCLLAQVMRDIWQRVDEVAQYQRFTLVDVVVLMVLALLQQANAGTWILLTLGILAGFELTAFRQLYGASVNNGIMTGNTKNFAVAGYQWLVHHDQTSKGLTIRLGATIGLFILGALVGAGICQVAVQDALWLAALIKVLLLIWLTWRRS